MLNENDLVGQSRAAVAGDPVATARLEAFLAMGGQIVAWDGPTSQTVFSTTGGAATIQLSRSLHNTTNTSLDYLSYVVAHELIHIRNQFIDLRAMGNPDWEIVSNDTLLGYWYQTEISNATQAFFDGSFHNQSLFGLPAHLMDVMNGVRPFIEQHDLSWSGAIKIIERAAADFILNNPIFKAQAEAFLRSVRPGSSGAVKVRPIGSAGGFGWEVIYDRTTDEDDDTESTPNYTPIDPMYLTTAGGEAPPGGGIGAYEPRTETECPLDNKTLNGISKLADSRNLLPEAIAAAVRRPPDANPSHIARFDIELAAARLVQEAAKGIAPYPTDDLFTVNISMNIQNLACPSIL